MAPRLYHTVRRLYAQVTLTLARLGIAEIGTPTAAALVGLYVTGLTCEYLAFDTHYTAGWFTKMVSRLGLAWVGTLQSRTHVIWQGHK